MKAPGTRTLPLAVLGSEVALVGLLTVPRAATALIAAIAATAGLLRPELAVFGLFLLAEELPASSSFLADAPRALTAGSELYRMRLGGVPLPMLVIGAAAVTLILRNPADGSSRSRWDRPAVLLLAALSAWSAALSMLQEEGPQLLPLVSHALAAAGPWLGGLAAYVVGSVVVRDHRARLATAVGAALVAKAALAVVMELATGGVRVDSQRYVIFYDAALPCVAGAVLVARLLVDRVASALQRLVTVSAAIVVLVSFRRAVWLMVVVALVGVPLVRRRSQVVRRAGIVALCATAALALAPDSVRSPVLARVQEAVGVAQGRTADRNSSQLHVDDINAGVALAKEHAIGGVGVRALQPPGFAVPPEPGRYLYVHNEPLQTWLRFGLPGLALLCGLLGYLGWRAVQLLGRDSHLDWVDASAAVIAAGIALPAMTAAFLSTTWRFPVLLGVAAAVVDHAHERTRRLYPDAPTPREATPAARAVSP